jgi:kinetochor protein Mis14/NSL1
MDAEHRKIELQAPTDLTYLASKIRTLARQKLDLHLPSQHDTAEPDELRKQVEDLVDAFVAQVLSGMRHNISINGIDVVRRCVVDGEEGEEEIAIEGMEEPSVAEVEEYEAFDEKLRGKLAAATQKRDDLISKISQHRRTTPALAARSFEQQFSREMEELERAGTEAERLGVRGAAEEVVGVLGLKRKREVERSWERAVEGLGRLNGGLPETRARLERCGDVVEYLGTGQKKRKETT